VIKRTIGRVWSAAYLAAAAAAMPVLTAPRITGANRSARAPGQSGQGQARPGRRPRRLPRPRPAVLGAAATWLVAAVTLFACYLHVARTAAVTSDGASNALQAWDMLHGNPLLRHWQLSDVSFYPTELGQYMLIERLSGLTPDVVHIASAMTYALLVLLAAIVAKGTATGRLALARCLVAAGIMLAPQLGDATYVLMGSPDHTGSAVPVLVTFGLLDMGPRRWYVAIAACALLWWALIADMIVVLTGVLPVLTVSLIRIYLARFGQRRRWRSTRFEIALAVTAVLAAWLATTTVKLIARHGGFVVWPVPTMLASADDVPRYLAVAGRGLLLLFGADFFGRPVGFLAALAMAHLIGLGLAAWGTAAAIRRFGHADLAAQLLASAILIILAAYVLGTRADDVLSTRDITAVLPFGAALAGRMLAGRLAAARMLPALGIVLAAYLVGLGGAVAAPSAQPQDARLASWLAAHRLYYGLAGYWDANITTVDTGGRVELRSVHAYGTRVAVDSWEVRSDWYDPKLNYANFIVLVPNTPGFKRYMTIASARETFGQPLRIYYLGRYTIGVWDQNLLADLRSGGSAAPGPPAVAP